MDTTRASLDQNLNPELEEKRSRIDAFRSRVGRIFSLGLAPITLTGRAIKGVVKRVPGVRMTQRIVEGRAEKRAINADAALQVLLDSGDAVSSSSINAFEGCIENALKNSTLAIQRIDHFMRQGRAKGLLREDVDSKLRSKYKNQFKAVAFMEKLEAK